MIRRSDTDDIGGVVTAGVLRISVIVFGSIARGGHKYSTEVFDGLFFESRVIRSAITGIDNFGSVLVGELNGVNFAKKIKIKFDSHQFNLVMVA